MGVNLMCRKLFQQSIGIAVTLIFLTGCGSPSPLATTTPQPPTPADAHVVYGMSATLDGKQLPQLVTITAESCFDGYGGYILSFSAVADMIPEAIDDEISLGLTIQIDDISQLPLGQPVDVAHNNDIYLSAATLAFLPPPQGVLTTATGTITLTALSYGEMSGSASLIFTDPGDVNPVVQNSLAYKVAFTNLAIIHYCPEN